MNGRHGMHQILTISGSIRRGKSGSIRRSIAAGGMAQRIPDNKI
jgi:hypothetical protein